MERAFVPFIGLVYSIPRGRFVEYHAFLPQVKGAHGDSYFSIEASIDTCLQNAESMLLDAARADPYRGKAISDLLAVSPFGAEYAPAFFPHAELLRRPEQPIVSTLFCNSRRYLTSRFAFVGKTAIVGHFYWGNFYDLNGKHTFERGFRPLVPMHGLVVKQKGTYQAHIPQFQNNIGTGLKQETAIAHALAALRESIQMRSSELPERLERILRFTSFQRPNEQELNESEVRYHVAMPSALALLLLDKGTYLGDKLLLREEIRGLQADIDVHFYAIPDVPSLP